jgi:hypothetical protein
MIKSFANKQLKALWETGTSRIDTRMHPRKSVNHFKRNKPMDHPKLRPAS